MTTVSGYAAHVTCAGCSVGSPIRQQADADRESSERRKSEQRDRNPAPCERGIEGAGAHATMQGSSSPGEDADGEEGRQAEPA